MARSARGESERETRRTRIDPKLIEQGWEVVPYDPNRPILAYTNHAVTEFPTDDGPADYGLFVAGRLLGITEGKRVTLGPQNVLTQSERYAKGVRNSPFNFRGFRVPFLYSTNGEVFWFHDVRDPLNRSRRVATFHTPAALQEMLGRDLSAACNWFGENANDHPRLRPYQIEANTAVEEAIADRVRLMLLAMATGTGKTFTLVNQVYRLMKSGVGKRVLFLVDRRVLAAQAVRAFASFEPEPSQKFDKIYEVYSQRFQRDDLDPDEQFDPKVLPGAYLTNPQPKHAFVYVCTIQRMAVNLFGRQAVWTGEGEDIDEDADQLKIPIHAFDVIIPDECHRGYTTAELSVWRNTLDHFDSIKIGLTATPAAHTKAYFRDVVYRYEYARAVREGYLVDYDVVNIKSNVRMEGVFLKQGETVEVVDPDTGNERLDLLEDERDFASTEVERTVTSPDSNRKILEEIKKYALEHEQRYGRFPKTLIFAANDLPHTSHADQLVELAVDIFGRGQGFVRKITGRADRPLQEIRQFRNRPEPGIVVSVDLMSTGVDIPDLEFIVFLRPVKSRILFEQMLGRGTRKGEKHPDKSHFTVFDCFDGTLLKYFREATAITADPPEKPSRTITEIIDDVWANRDRDYNVRCLVKRLQRIEKEMALEARDMFAVHIPEGDMGRFAANLPAKIRNDFTATMKLLRTPAFQELLTNYPRPARTFVRAIETVDEVSSEYHIRSGSGRDFKPEDYLIAFSRYVQENPEQVEAIRILLDRPQGWNTAALTELKTKLATAPDGFTVESLQKAHQVCYKKSLVDIISMVKHAAREQEPLLTAAERVDRAFEQVTEDRDFTAEQRQWLDRIRAHLIENLSIDREDFDDLPVFARYGGWARANRDFEGSLSDMLRGLNEAIAAKDGDVGYNFEEKQYELAANLELGANTPNMYPPGQVLEGLLGFDLATAQPKQSPIWAILGVGFPAGIQLQPNLWLPGALPLSASLPTYAVSLMLQYKRSDYKPSARSKHHSYWRSRYYEYTVTTPQHTILINLETAADPDAVVRYAAPVFHLYSDLEMHQLKSEVLVHSNFVSPGVIGPAHQAWSFATPGIKGLANPESEELEAESWLQVQAKLAATRGSHDTRGASQEIG